MLPLGLRFLTTGELVLSFEIQFFCILVAGWCIAEQPTIQKVIGEDRSRKRSALHSSLVPAVWLLYFPALSFYVLISGVINTNPAAQSLILLIAPVLGGLAFNAATGPGLEDKEELLCAAQKFIMATIFFLFFLPLFYVAGDLLKVDPASWEWTSVSDYRAVLFWAAAVGFFGGISLFIVGLVDLVFALVGLRSKSL